MPGNSCQMCLSRYSKEKKQVPCMDKNIKLCTVIQGTYGGLAIPPNINYNSSLAFEIYLKTVAFSGQDFNGYPMLTKIEFVMDNMDIILTVSQRELILNKVMFIYNIICNNITEKNKPTN